MLLGPFPDPGGVSVLIPYLGSRILQGVGQAVLEYLVGYDAFSDYSRTRFISQQRLYRRRLLYPRGEPYT
jgi:hypothetical protein